MSENNDLEKIKMAVRTGISGLWRFYDDGFTRWPINKLAALFSNLDLEHPEIQKELRRLQKEGLLKLHGKTDCYLEVIQPPQS
jgi:hypothetical protein